MAQILGFWVTYGVKWCHYVMFVADSHLKLLPTSILDMYKVFEHIDMLSIGIQYHPYTVIPTLLSLDLEFWVTCGVKWCDYVGWQPTQTASHIHIRHMQSVWARWYAVHMHMVAALHSYTCPTLLRFWGSGSRLDFILCGTKCWKRIPLWYLSYRSVDQYWFLRGK
jgi:hypothetical protein